MRILFTPYCGGSIAHVVRSLAIADEARGAGHEVLFTASCSRRSFIESAGYGVFGDGHPDVNLNDDSDQGVSYLKTNRGKFLEWFADEIEAAKSFRPDVIVNSPTFFGAIASLSTSIPHISITNGNWLPSYKGILGLAKSEDSLRHAIGRQLLNPVLAKGFDSIYLAEIQGWYRELGLNRLPTSKRDLHGELSVIVPSIPSLEPLTGTNPRVSYVGPLQWMGFEKEHLDLPFGIPKKPLIYLTLGGSAFNPEMYRLLIRCLATRPEWNVVVSLGPNINRQDLPDNSPNLVIRKYLPGLAVCALADVVVCAGNHGTLMQALAYGKPCVTIPMNIDQACFAERLVELNAGITLNRVGLLKFTKRESYIEGARRISPEKIAQAVERALSSAKLRAGAQRLQEEIQLYTTPAKAALDLIIRAAQAR